GDAMVFDALTRIDYATGQPEIQPALALSWTNKDPLTWQFKLRPNVKFHNGDAFTADDVKYTFQRIMDPNNKAAALPRATSFKQITAVDPLTVEIVTKNPDPLMLKELAVLYIVPGKYFQAQGEANFSKKPVGTGWYQALSYDPQVALALQAFDGG